MGIQIANAVSMPAVTYDKIHVTKLEINQPVFDDDNVQPVYQVIVSYRHYGVTDNVRYYKTEDVNRVSIEDFIQLAGEKAAQGNMTLVQALTSIESAIASILESQTGVQTSII